MRRFPHALVLGCLALLALADARAQQASEAAVKAAFLYKFPGYVEWGTPPQPGAPFVIGVAGSDEIAEELERLVPGRPIGGRPATVRRVRDVEGVRGTQILFIGRAEANARALIRAARDAGSLAVTETERGLEQGSVINFVAAEERIGFEVSVDAADKSGVRISSRMLAVARRVVPRP